MQHKYSLPEIGNLPLNVKFVILQANWHSEITDLMVSHCKQVLAHYGFDDKFIIEYKAPGALELPVLAKWCVEQHKQEENLVLICFGAIVKGETYHFNMVADEVTRGLGRLAYEFTVPVIQEVLAVESLEQLRARAGDDEYNKGREAALAALQLISVIKVV